MKSKYKGYCNKCNSVIEVGDIIKKDINKWVHKNCNKYKQREKERKLIEEPMGTGYNNPSNFSSGYSKYD